MAGGLAGKGVGEIIDPTTEDNWLRDNFKSRPYAKQRDTFEKYHPAYRHGAAAESRYGDAKFETVESDVRSEWERLGDTADYPWGRGARRRQRFIRTEQLDP